MKITRRNLRGSRLLPECNRAIVYQNKINEDLCVSECQGGIDEMTDDPWEPCRSCGAWFNNIQKYPYRQC